MRIPVLFLLTCTLGSAGAAELPEGKHVFDRYCAECHAAGFGHPGTQELGWTRGPSMAVLEARHNLLPAYIAVVVRNGLSEMPPYRPTEINDAELKALIQYLTKKKTDAKGR